MKRILCAAIAAIMCLSLIACSKNSETKQENGAEYIELTVMSSTMVYSEVLNMMIMPEDYIGKKVKMHGAFSYAEGLDKYYYACIIADATACCSQGIEFALKEEKKFPDEFPELGEEITVEGIFDTYVEDGITYCQLKDSVMTK